MSPPFRMIYMRANMNIQILFLRYVHMDIKYITILKIPPWCTPVKDDSTHVIPTLRVIFAGDVPAHLASSLKLFTMWKNFPGNISNLNVVRISPMESSTLGLGIQNLHSSNLQKF